MRLPSIDIYHFCIKTLIFAISNTIEMEIKNLKKHLNPEDNQKLKKRLETFEKLIIEIRKKEIPSEIVETINGKIDEINHTNGGYKAVRKQIWKSKNQIVKLLEKELKIAPKNLYRNRWMAIGISTFGVPMGVAFGASMNNMGFIGVGIPIGMVIGMAIGAGMDKKALEEGRQLDIEIEF